MKCKEFNPGIQFILNVLKETAFLFVSFVGFISSYFCFYKAKLQSKGQLIWVSESIKSH